METAMDIVRRAAEGAIDHDELVRILKTWHYEPHYKTTGLADDWQTVPNSELGPRHCKLIACTCGLR